MEWGVVAALAVVVVCGLLALGGARAADRLVYDALTRLDARPPRDDIVLVAIDNRSLQALGAWPWPRQIHAALLQRLASYGPKAVAYDVLFVEPTPDDRQLAAAMIAARPVVLPLILQTPGDNGAPFKALEPVEPIRTAAVGIGEANLDFDDDGVVRQVYLAEGDSRRQWLHTMELVRRIGEGLPSPATPDATRDAAPAGPFTRGAPMLISFAGPPGHFRTVSLIDVLRGETPADVLRGKLVLVGATADGLGDRYPTPVTTDTVTMSGIELQANILDSLLGRHLIRPLPLPALAVFSLAPVALLLLGFLRFKPATNMYLGLGLAGACLLASLALFVGARVWAPPTAALVGLALVYPLWSWRRLAATSAYMLDELGVFSKEFDDLPLNLADAGGDAIDRQVSLMHEAIGRARDLRQFMADTLGGLPDATLVIDMTGRVLMANDAAGRLLAPGLGGALIGRSIDEILASFSRVAPPDQPANGAPAAAPSLDGEFETADGAVFLIREAAFHDAAQFPRGRIVRLTDITEMKLAIRQRERVLQFLSHDMRSPQVSILSLLEAWPADDHTARDTARRIGGYARLTLALADNFVSLAKAENAPYALEEVNLADIVLDAVDALWPQAQARNVAVSATGCDDEYLVRADRSLLTRAFVNLIDNAIKFSPAGAPIDCAVSACPDDPRQAMVIVRDRGCGMSTDDLNALFEPFYRGQDRDRIRGVGLGLAFVKTVVARHSGAIACESVVGEGTSFTVTLPLAASARPSEA